MSLTVPVGAHSRRAGTQQDSQDGHPNAHDIVPARRRARPTAAAATWSLRPPLLAAGIGVTGPDASLDLVDAGDRLVKLARAANAVGSIGRAA